MDNLSYVKEHLLHPAGIDDAFLMQSLALLQERKLDFGDIFFEHEVSESFRLSEGIIKHGNYNILAGVGVRAQVGDKTGFAFADAIDQGAILDACKAARSISRGQQCAGVNVTPTPLKALAVKPLYVQDNPLESLTRNDKIALMQEAL